MPEKQYEFIMNNKCCIFCGGRLNGISTVETFTKDPKESSSCMTFNCGFSVTFTHVDFKEDEMKIKTHCKNQVKAMNKIITLMENQ